MKKMTWSLLLAASLLLVSSCNLNLIGRASEPKTVRGGPIALAKGAASWTGSMRITVTGSEDITFEAVGWSGAGGTGNVLYLGWNTFTLTESDTSGSLSMGLEAQLRTWTEQTGADKRSFTSIASSSDVVKLAAVDKGDELGGYIYTSSLIAL